MPGGAVVAQLPLEQWVLGSNPSPAAYFQRNLHHDPRVFSE